MYNYEIEIFVNERPEQKTTVEAWASWTAIKRVADIFKDRIKKTNRVGQKVVYRCIRLK